MAQGVSVSGSSGSILFYVPLGWWGSRSGHRVFPGVVRPVGSTPPPSLSRRGFWGRVLYCTLFHVWVGHVWAGGSDDVGSWTPAPRVVRTVPDLWSGTTEVHLPGTVRHFEPQWFLVVTPASAGAQTQSTVCSLRTFCRRASG